MRGFKISDIVFVESLTSVSRASGHRRGLINNIRYSIYAWTQLETTVMTVLYQMACDAAVACRLRAIAALRSFCGNF